MRRFLRPGLDSARPVEAIRHSVERFALLSRTPKHILIDETRLGNRPALALKPPQADPRRVILYLHGGAFIFGSPKTHKAFTAYLAQAANCTVYSLDYRLAPEDPAPAAVHDTLAAYQELQEKHPDACISVSGDSAGAGLALSLGFELLDRGQQPAAYMLFCPWTDLRLENESIKRNRQAEPMLTKELLAMAAEYYAAGQPLDTLALSPALGDFSGFAPMYIQAAGRDILLDDARVVAQKAKEAGVVAKLDVFADHGHDFQATPDIVPEAQRAVMMAGAWIKATCAPS